MDLVPLYHNSTIQVVDVIGDMFIHMFRGLHEQYKEEIEFIAQQYPCEPFKFLEPSLGKFLVWFRLFLSSSQFQIYCSSTESSSQF